MISLYHGSNMVIEEIDLQKTRPYKDFGRGFYLTSMKEQAQKMAQRVSRIYGGEPYAMEYIFHEEKLKEMELNTRIFEGPSKEWALFVINNRNRDYQDINSIECNHDNKYDLVIGPVADDDLALLFRQFSGGLISVEVLVEAMKFKKLTNQYSFHTERALELLEKAGWNHG